VREQFTHACYSHGVINLQVRSVCALSAKLEKFTRKQRRQQHALDLYLLLFICFSSGSSGSSFFFSVSVCRSSCSSFPFVSVFSFLPVFFVFFSVSVCLLLSLLVSLFSFPCPSTLSLSFSPPPPSLILLCSLPPFSLFVLLPVFLSSFSLFFLSRSFVFSLLYVPPPPFSSPFSILCLPSVLLSSPSPFVLSPLPVPFFSSVFIAQSCMCFFLLYERRSGPLLQ